MKTLYTGKRGDGKTQAIIDEAAVAQDEGAELVIIVVPQAKWVDHMYDRMVETLDMSRVAVVPAYMAEEFIANNVQRYVKSKGQVYLAPPSVLIDDADLIPPRTLVDIEMAAGSRLRMSTGTNRPGTWYHDTTPLDKL